MLPEIAMKRSFSAVDLFCGVGGLTHGLIKAGINVNAGIDIDKTSRYPYETNNDATFIEEDITNLTKNQIDDLYPKNDIKILVGCAPCQPFSKHTQKNKERSKSNKWTLLRSFARLINEVQPHVVSMENVAELASKDIFDEFVNNLKKQNYHVSWESVYCPKYGIPQKRTRLVLLASKLGPITLIPKTHTPDNYKTVKQTIGKLPPVSAGKASKRDPLHKTRALSGINMKRMKQSKPGGTWNDWDKELILPCHKKKTGETYSAVYGRMVWNEPSPTITTQFHTFGTGRFGHPTQNRALSLREGAMLQTFPKSYKFVEPGQPVATTRLGVHIGNAVPVKLGTVIGKSIIKHLEEIYGEEKQLHI